MKISYNEISCPYCRAKVIIPMRKDLVCPINLRRTCELCHKKYRVKNNKSFPIKIPKKELNPTRRDNYEEDKKEMPTPL